MRRRTLNIHLRNAMISMEKIALKSRNAKKKKRDSTFIVSAIYKKTIFTPGLSSLADITKKGW
jgi:hypothetical protein